MYSNLYVTYGQGREPMVCPCSGRANSAVTAFKFGQRPSDALIVRRVPHESSLLRQVQHRSSGHLIARAAVSQLRAAGAAARLDAGRALRGSACLGRHAHARASGRRGLLADAEAKQFDVIPVDDLSRAFRHQGDQYDTLELLRYHGIHVVPTPAAIPCWCGGRSWRRNSLPRSKTSSRRDT